MFKKRKVAKTATRTEIEAVEEQSPKFVASTERATQRSETRESDAQKPNAQKPEAQDLPDTTVLENKVPKDKLPESKSQETELRDTKSLVDAGTYKGIQKPKNKYGPIAASSTIRTTVFTDYQPDVCKDYKQTGYCGYGDSCKFLHIRENYAAGWQLDEDQTHDKKPARPATEAKLKASEETKSKETDPNCGVCKKSPVVPVKTKCGHLYCEACFLASNRKTGACAVCGQQTDGIVKRVK